jgi:hypothetical protein
MLDDQQEITFDDEIEVAEETEEANRFALSAFVIGKDWTIETIVSQLQRKNILLNPGFQRRDAWSRERKSLVIESLIVGLPIPQIVLAESKTDRGKFIVLDGKQRLLSILQFWGLADGENNGYSLSGLTIRTDLKRKDFSALSTDPSLEPDYNSLCNQTIRTVVILGWKDTDFLHTVFLRLNTGSLKLSPQELRQALQPGKFSDYIDIAAGESKGLRGILKTSAPDPRMRDTEILARYLSFYFFAMDYPGRMKDFLDSSFEKLNKSWDDNEIALKDAVTNFELGISELNRVFGSSLARKPGSPQFNRAIFDVLIYYHSKQEIRESLKNKDEELAAGFSGLFDEGSDFSSAIESDTAGTPNTFTRIRIWAETLSSILGFSVAAPAIPLRSRQDPAQLVQNRLGIGT